MKHNMNDVIISGKNLELTEALKNIVQEKMEKLFSHERHIIRIRVELEYSPNVSGEKEFIAKGNIEIKGRSLVATAETDDLYKAVDLMEEKLHRLIRRRARLRKAKRKHPHDVEIPAEIPKTRIA